MNNGYIKLGAVTNDVVVANPLENAKNIIKKINLAHQKRVKVLVFPELAISGATCGDLFFQDALLKDSLVALDLIRRNTTRKNMLVIVGLPLKHNNKLYNVVAYLNKGKILGFVPKTYISSSENRYFSNANDTVEVVINSNKYLMGTNLLFKCLELEELVVASEIGSEAFNPLAPSSFHALNGATIICNSSALNEEVIKDRIRFDILKNHSYKLKSGYVYAGAGEGESTQDLVFSGHNMIFENGEVLCVKNNFKNNLLISEIDVQKLVFLRSRDTSFNPNKVYQTIYFNLKIEEETLTRSFPTCNI